MGTLDYRMIPDVSISWMVGRVSKYSADHVLLGVDTFTGIETILELIAFQGPPPNLTS
jgi:hypothetical protein